MSITATDKIGSTDSADDEIHLMDYPDSDEEIPTLDFTEYLNGTVSGRESVAAHLKEISETVGFFYLKGHGIEQSLVDSMFEQSRRFHALPDDVKRKIPYVAHDTFRSGYQPCAVERNAANINLISDAKPNLLAKLSVNREVDGQSVNIWPDNLPGFREVVTAYHLRIEKLARSFLPLWATALTLPLDYFEPYFKNPHLTLSMLHYPPQKAVGDRQYGIAPHTDNSLMTFLAQSNVGGLAVRMPSGHWRLVEAVPGTFLVNTGNLMVRWTNDQFLSTKHRVINTANVDRYSLPVFFGPSVDALIECVPTCRGDQPAKYEPITYGKLRDWYYGVYE